jgi:hypothetical protein
LAGPRPPRSEEEAIAQRETARHRVDPVYRRIRRIDGTEVDVPLTRERALEEIRKLDPTYQVPQTIGPNSSGVGTNNRPDDQLQQMYKDLRELREQTYPDLYKFRSSAPSPALSDSPYSPSNVAARNNPPYQANPAHGTQYNINKTPEPTDAQSVYESGAVRGGMGTWYGRGQGGYYRYFSDNAGAVHFSGTVPEAKVPNEVMKALEK